MQITIKGTIKLQQIKETTKIHRFMQNLDYSRMKSREKDLLEQRLSLECKKNY